MYNYICYLKGKKENIDIVRMLSVIFKCGEEYIGDLLDNENLKIKFENRVLDDVSQFCVELNVYTDDVKNIIFSNNFLFGVEVSKYLNEEIIISSKGDDPYQWILVENNLFFIVEEIDSENHGITLRKSNKVKISYNDAINISS